MKNLLVAILATCVVFCATDARADFPVWADGQTVTAANMNAYDDSISAAISDSLSLTPRFVTTANGMLKLLDGDDLTNGQYVGFTDSITAGENLVLGNLIYQEPTTNNWLKAQADSAASCGAQAIALGSISAGAMGLVLRYGYIKVDAWTTVGTEGAVYVDDDTAGLPVITVPPDAGDAVFSVGSCVGTDLLFFNPPPPIYYVVRD